jgi:hypothetical protein
MNRELEKQPQFFKGSLTMLDSFFLFESPEITARLAELQEPAKQDTINLIKEREQIWEDKISVLVWRLLDTENVRNLLAIEPEHSRLTAFDRIRKSFILFTTLLAKEFLTREDKLELSVAMMFLTTPQQ